MSRKMFEKTPIFYMYTVSLYLQYMKCYSIMYHYHHHDHIHYHHQDTHNRCGA